MTTTYYKVTNKDECHRGFQYKDGLNILTEPFDDNPENTYCKGGLYFSAKEFIHFYYGHGVWLREVFLPTDNPDFKMVKYQKSNSFRANMIILGKKYDLHNIDDISYIFKNINSNIRYFVTRAAMAGNLEILKFVKNTMTDFENFINFIVDFACYNGRANVLEWLQNSKIDFKYNESSIMFASRGGHVNVLEWFKNSGLEFKHDHSAVEGASLCGHTNVLEWFKNSGFKFKYSPVAIVRASGGGHVNVLEWFKNSGSDWFKNSKSALKQIRFCAEEIASKNGHTNVLEWFKNFESELETKNIE